MAKYKGIICGHVYDDAKEKIKFEDLSDTWVCPICFVSKSMFIKLAETAKEIKEEVPEGEENTIDFNNAIKISKDNICIKRISEKCINCGVCTNTCMERQGIQDLCGGKACVNCGQCIQKCPTGALVPKSDIEKLESALKSNKICIAYTAPSVRVALGDAFNMEPGSFVQGKLVASLRSIGFKYVFDVTFGADLTIMEEANELVERIQNNGVLPMFTSCCPAWVKYAEMFYPQILEHLSNCKSPIGMQGEMIKKYFIKKMNINPNDVFTVAITPCTAKKYEIARVEIGGTDCVLTTRELIEILKNKNIDIKNLGDSNYDSLLGEGSGAGMIFGNTGGVMEAALREANYILTKDYLPSLEFQEVRGLDNVKEASITINNLVINVAIIHGISAAKKILEDVKNGVSKYHYIEVMNCFGGCIGGGGQPQIDDDKEIMIKEKRIASLYKKDKESKYRYSHDNPDVQRIYKEFLGKPLSQNSKIFLHTNYFDKSEEIK
ncbi:MAG: hydrogenase [Firmicutes bacterium]|nr:hydrogenase [Bacillota bacterium]